MQRGTLKGMCLPTQVVLDSEFAAEVAEQAHERLEKGLNTGKVIIIMDEQIANVKGKA